jgi:hypothetical protein
MTPRHRCDASTCVLFPHAKRSPEGFAKCCRKLRSDGARWPRALTSVLTAVVIAFQSSDVLALDAGSSPSGSQLPEKLQAKESADSALAAERAEMEPRYRKRGLGLDFEGATPNSHFYTWDVIPTWGEGIDYFIVDRRTGDVWSAFDCKLAHSQELAHLQARFRRRFGVPAWRVRKIESEGYPGLGC